MLGWLWGSRDDEEQRVLETQQSVKAAIEMAEAKLRASAAAAGSANASASEEILKRLAEMETRAAQSANEAAASGANAARSEVMLAKLEEMSAYLGQMDERMAELRLESDEHAQEQARQLSLVHTKLDALLTGSHEQVFHYFILVPKPQKGYLGRALDKLKPCHWCNHAAPQASLH